MDQDQLRDLRGLNKYHMREFIKIMEGEELAEWGFAKTKPKEEPFKLQRKIGTLGSRDIDVLKKDFLALCQKFEQNPETLIALLQHQFVEHPNEMRQYNQDREAEARAAMTPPATPSE